MMNILFITKGIKQMNSRYDHGENPGDNMFSLLYRTCHRDVGRHLRSKSDMDWDIYRYTFCYWNTAMKSPPFIDEFPLHKKKLDFMYLRDCPAARHVDNMEG